MYPPPSAVMTLRRFAVARRTSSAEPWGRSSTVSSPPHEREVTPELLLQGVGLHPRASGLDRIENINSDVDKIGDDRAERSATVICDMQSCRTPDIDHPPEVRLHEIAPHGRTDHQGLLSGNIVSRPEPVEGVLWDRCAGEVCGEVGTSADHP